VESHEWKSFENFFKNILLRKVVLAFVDLPNKRAFFNSLYYERFVGATSSVMPVVLTSQLFNRIQVQNWFL
jgi:hypothetical protein